jgi:hypothetical protein
MVSEIWVDNWRASYPSNGSRRVKKTSCSRNRVGVQIDDAIELAHRAAHRTRQFLEVEPGAADMASEIDRAEIANRRVAGASDLEDLRAHAREMNGIAAGARLIAGQVCLVLESHPAVTGVRDAANHSRVEIARGNDTRGETPRFGPKISRVELVTEQIGKLRHVGRVEQ